jgi:hypothetical protein
MLSAVSLSQQDGGYEWVNSWPSGDVCLEYAKSWLSRDVSLQEYAPTSSPTFQQNAIKLAS